MRALAKCSLLFSLNLLDAQLTLFWVRMGVAREGNFVMSRLLECGEGPFLAVKLAIGAFAAWVLYRWYDRALARRGLALALGLYLALMFLHGLTALSAFDYEPIALMAQLFNRLSLSLLR